MENGQQKISKAKDSIASVHQAVAAGLDAKDRLQN